MINETTNLLQQVNRGQNGVPIFEAGKIYTIFRINSMMAMTSKQVIKITRFDVDGNPIYKEQPRGRKEFILRLKTRAYVSAPEKMFDGLVFEGEIDFSCDTDSGSIYYSGRMAGNALYNFVGNPEIIKKTIQDKQRNPWAEISLCIHVSKEGVETILFPELYDGGHAVIDQIQNNERRRL